MTWTTVFHDDKAQLVRYEPFTETVIGSPPPGFGLQAKGNLILLGEARFVNLGETLMTLTSYIRPKLERAHRDVDVTVKVRIVATAPTDQFGEPGVNNWFGVSTRALRRDIWSGYLFYVRQNGNVEFGLERTVEDRKLKFVPEISEQPVTLHLRVEGERVQAWVNDRPCLDWRDERKEFIRNGHIYLIAYSSLVEIHECTIKVKKWYAPLTNFIRRFWRVIVVISTLLGVITGIYFLVNLLR